MSDWVMVFKHRGVTAQIPPPPRWVYKTRWKVWVVCLLKILARG